MYIVDEHYEWMPKARIVLVSESTIFLKEYTCLPQQLR